MSILVFAGSAQFIAIAMLSAGASPVSIILTTMVVNLRHTLIFSLKSRSMGATVLVVMFLYWLGGFFL